MLRVKMSEVINRPVEEVWTVITNFDNWAKAARSGSEFRQTSAGPMGPGATVESSRKILGRTLRLHTIVVTEYEPNRALGITDKVPGLRPIAGRYTFEPAPEGTRVTRSAEVDLGRGRVLQPLFRPLLRRIWRSEGTAMKRFIETGA
jgi:hypothetical protein